MIDTAAPTPRTRKPWRRPRNLVLGVTAVLLLVVGREVYRAVTAEPGLSVDYGRALGELIESRAPRAGNAANSWPLIERITAISEEVNAELRARELPTPTDGTTIAPWDFTIDFDPTASYNEASRAFIRDANALARRRFDEAGLPALLDEVARRTRCIPPEQEGEMIGWLLPELGCLRNLARLNAGNMAIATREGDGAAWVRAYTQMIGSARSECQQAFLISRLVGIAIFALANNELARGCIERRWDEPTLRAALDAFDRQLALVPGADLSIECERLSMLDTIQWTHTDDGRGDGRLILSSARSLGGMYGTNMVQLPEWLRWAQDYKIINMASVGFASKKATTRKANQFIDAAVAYAKASPPQRAAMANPDAMVEALSPRYALLRMLTPALGKSLQSDDLFRTVSQGTRVLLALEIYRARHGAYPEALDALAPEVLPEVPRDPVNGKAFGYRLLTDDPDGRAYLLYSLGLDGVDDGGKTDKDNLPTAVTNKRKSPGLDYIINRPREKPRPPEPADGSGGVSGG